VNLDARVAALEGKRAGGTGVHKPTPRRVITESKTKPTEPKVITELKGYKSMAVVSNRAWIATPDGNEASVIAGDAIPNARVRSINADSGVVITTTDQRIEPR
jgi:hypothetical protein